MGERVLVIGATLIDVKGKPTAGLAPGTSNPSNIRVTRGGTARNVAENLGHLGAEVTLISAVGDVNRALAVNGHATRIHEIGFRFPLGSPFT